MYNIFLSIIIVLIAILLIIFREKITNFQIKEFERKQKENNLIFYKKSPNPKFTKFVFLFIGIVGVLTGVVIFIKSLNL